MEKPQYIISDLDGTIALIGHRQYLVKGKNRNFDKFNDLCDKDTPNLAVIEVLKTLRSAGYKLIITSGRDDRAKEKTVNWLKQHGIEYEMLLMRRSGDYTPDQELKEQWLLEKLPPKENILCVFDDRNRVVDMWRSHGLSCFQVAEGNF